jgi:hypothetical protein
VRLLWWIVLGVGIAVVIFMYVLVYALAVLAAQADRYQEELVERLKRERGLL